jgi:hypothetical protein
MQINERKMVRWRIGNPIGRVAQFRLHLVATGYTKKPHFVAENVGHCPFGHSHLRQANQGRWPLALA